MSVLEGILLEEYERCIRRKKVWKEALKDPERQEWRESDRRALRLTKKDMRMLRRALGFRLLREKFNKNKE